MTTTACAGCGSAFSCTYPDCAAVRDAQPAAPGIRVHPKFALRMLIVRNGELQETTIYAHERDTLEEIQKLMAFNANSVLFEEWDGTRWS